MAKIKKDNAEGNAAAKEKTKKRKTNKKPRVSYTVKPDGLSLRDWQVILRRQAAIDERLTISSVDERLAPGEYSVVNPKTNSTYKVVYRGANSEWNYCSCMDFKTSRLGTCKHIEAVKRWFGGGRRVHREIPPYTSVYLSYRAERCVRIRIGSDNRNEFETLAKDYFDESGVLRSDAYARFGVFLKHAVAINDTFRCYGDAIDFITEQIDRNERIRIVDKYTDADLDSILNTTLYPYQKEGVRFAAKTGKAIIADEMGLGKTIQAICTAELLRREGLATDVLVLCPTSLKYQWKHEIEKFTGAKVLVVEGNHLKRCEAYAAAEPYKIVSYNSACNDIKILGHLSADMLIMDEVQRLKNWNTQISRAARRIKSQYAVILSGTPLENKLEELYSVTEFVDQFCLAPYYLFRDHHIIADEVGKVIGYKNLNEIGERLRGVLIRRRKKDVRLQMPERTDNNILVPMTKEQMGMHNEFKFTISQLIQKWHRNHFLSETDRNRLLLTLSQMRMVCDSTYILDQKTRYDTKVEEVLNIISNLTDGTEEKVVVFSQWERMTRLVAGGLDKRGIEYEYLHGGIPSVKRKDLVDNFTNLPEKRVFLSTDAGSTGLNLQVASTIINIDLPWNPAVLEQRIARIYRLGQRNNIQVINLIAPDSIEEQMVGKLRFKASMAEGTLDNGKDTIFLGDNKFSKIVEMVSEMVTDNEDESHNEDPSTISTDDKEPPVADTPSTSTADIHTDIADDELENETQISPIRSTGTSKTSENHKTSEPHPDSPQDLIKQGVTFFKGLARTLKSPDETEKLLNSIVTKDETTGETSIKIPVPDRQTVKQLLDIVGKIFG